MATWTKPLNLSATRTWLLPSGSAKAIFTPRMRRLVSDRPASWLLIRAGGFARSDITRGTRPEPTRMTVRSIGGSSPKRLLRPAQSSSSVMGAGRPTRRITGSPMSKSTDQISRRNWWLMSESTSITLMIDKSCDSHRSTSRRRETATSDPVGLELAPFSLGLDGFARFLRQDPAFAFCLDGFARFLR